MFVAEGVVDATAEVVAGLGGNDALLNTQRLESGIKNRSVDNGVFFDVPAFHIEAEGGAFVDGPAEATAEEAGLIRGLISGEGVTRVERFVGEVEERVAAKLVRTGLREDLDTAKADAVELGGIRILVDADFADGRFGRDASAGEAVDKDLTAVRAGTGAGEGLQLLR